MKPDFKTWRRENLEKFASDSFDEILHLQADLKAAIEAYRNLNTRRENEVQSSNSDSII